MNCPKCGNRMEPGTVYSPGGYLFWTSEQGKLKIFNGQKTLSAYVLPETAPSPLFRQKPSPHSPGTPVGFAGTAVPYYFPLKTKNNHLP